MDSLFLSFYIYHYFILRRELSKRNSPLGLNGLIDVGFSRRRPIHILLR
ncbi:MAG: hypothetical protein ACTS4Z_00130 [Candidatus Hodgkinia cicadicola]